MRYSEILDINKNFLYSVNIEYDLNDEKKIKEYIPTSDVCDVLKVYIKSILGYEKNRSTLLLGPYGKGKSFLILSLLRIVCFDRNQYTDCLLEKIKIVDEELFTYIEEVYKKQIKLLPIIIDSNYFNIEQSFLLALNESLQMFGLNDIIPRTVFQVCIELIENWENNKEIIDLIHERCEKQIGCSLTTLKSELIQFDVDAYYKFEKLYNCITPGLKFNPMVSSDIVKTYSDVCNELKKHDYNGMFIVYDEFSKTLEAKNSFLAHDLKVVQDFAEKAARSSNDEQINLCCITHKAFNLYFKGEKSTLSDAFKTVSGRFNEIRFNRSLDQNYQIISFTLNRKYPIYQQQIEKTKKENQWFYKKIKDSAFFDENDLNILVDNCYPFNPLTVYVLIRLSELIAQNERTMFTLISDTNESSFNSFINNNNCGLYNTNLLYDYFSSLLQNECEELKSIWYKCETACKKVVEKTQKDILKTLAIIEMINDYSKLYPTEEMLVLLLEMKDEEIQKHVSEMISSGIIKKSASNNYLDFANSFTKEIEDSIQRKISVNNSKNNLDILDRIDLDTFVIPRKYNSTFKITRFYKIVYLFEKDYLQMNSFSILLTKYFCDGIVLRLLDVTDIEIDKKHFNEMGENDNVVLAMSKASTEILVEQISRVKALVSLGEDSKNDSSLISQVSLMLEENKRDLNQLIYTIFNEENTVFVSKSKKLKLIEIVNDLCYCNYSKTPKANIEMLNKNIVSSNYQKPRNVIINMILDRKYDMVEGFSTTSPEMTIYNVFYSNNKIDNESLKIVEKIKEYLLSNHQKKKSLQELVNNLTSIPYGIRLGVLPIYLAIAISNMDDNSIMYYENAEVEINAINIDKACHNPEKFYFVVSEKQEEQDNYLKGVIEEFSGLSSTSFYNNVKTASSLLKRWAMSLPMIIKEVSADNNFIDLETEFIKLKDLLLRPRLNAYELMIHDIPMIFNNSYDTILLSLHKYKHYDDKINSYISEIGFNIRDKFIMNYLGSINSCYVQWVKNEHINVENTIFEGQGKAIHNLLCSRNYDDNEVINSLAEIVTRYRINDWSSDNSNTLFKAIDTLILSLKSTVPLPDNKYQPSIEISAMGQNIKNTIESAIDEYADSVSNEEKVAILYEIMKRYIGDNK